MNHWSKFHILFPLSRKFASEVGLHLQTKAFAFLGTPRTFHSDNGRELVNEIVLNLVKEWLGETAIVNGRPRNPKSQGLIKQRNRPVQKKKIGACFQGTKASDYPLWS